MTARKLAGKAVGLPRHRVPKTTGGNVFDLSSHERARDALSFGLSVSAPRYNIFVIGEERSARMTATMEFLEQSVADRPAPPDWVYLNNFRETNRPKPYALPPGVGRGLCRRLEVLINSILSPAQRVNFFD